MTMKNTNEPSTFSYRNLIALILGLTFYLGEGINYSQLGPFFPTEAKLNHDTSTTFVGVITSSFDIANFIAVFVLNHFINPSNQKFFFCAGAFLSAAANTLFGAMGWTEGGGWPFIIVCILIRATMGFGGCMMWTTGLALLVPLFPQWSGRILSVIQCFLGLGQMIGPSFGSALYAVGGYPSPFFVSGGIQIFFCFLCTIFLPNTVLETNEPSSNKGMQILKTIRESDSGSHSGSRETLVSQPRDEEDETEEEQGFFYFVTRPLVICASLPLIIQSSSMGFIEVAVGPYLDQYFGIDGKTSGYFFLVFSALYALGAPVIGALVDKGHGGKIFASSSFLAGLGFVMMFVPMLFTQVESPYWLLIWLGAQGLAGAGCFVTGQLVFESIAYAVGFDDANKIKVMTTGCSCAGYSIGRICGPILTGGLFMNTFGYYYSCLLQGALLLIASIFGFVVCLKHGLMGKIYYKRDDESSNVKTMFTTFYQSLSLASTMTAMNRSGSVSAMSNRDSMDSSSIFVLQSARQNQLISVSYSYSQKQMKQSLNS